MISQIARENRECTGIMDYRLEALLKHEPAEKISNWDVARGLDLYIVYVNGFCLTFMKSHQPYGTRCYRLDDDLAKCLGFGTLKRMKEVLPIRKSRRFISVDTLRRAVNRYAERSMDLFILPRKSRENRQISK